MTEKSNVFSLQYELEVTEVGPVFWDEQEERAFVFVYKQNGGCLGLCADDIQVPLTVSLLGSDVTASYQLQALKGISPGDKIVQTTTNRQELNQYGLWRNINEIHNQIIKAV